MIMILRFWMKVLTVISKTSRVKFRLLPCSSNEIRPVNPSKLISLISCWRWWWWCTFITVRRSALSYSDPSTTSYLRHLRRRCKIFPAGVKNPERTQKGCFEQGLLCFVSILCTFGCKISKPQNVQVLKNDTFQVCATFRFECSKFVKTLQHWSDPTRLTLTRKKDQDQTEHETTTTLPIWLIQ